MTELVGISGRKRSGKNTFASALVDELGFVEVNFADPLKAALLRLDPIVDITLGADGVSGVPLRLSTLVREVGLERAKNDWPEVRALMQRFGTEAIRTIDPDFWVRAWQSAVEAVALTGKSAVATDVRFPNEADAIHTIGGDVIRIERDFEIPVSDNHPSERVMDDYDFFDAVFDNNGSIAELKALALDHFTPAKENA